MALLRWAILERMALVYLLLKLTELYDSDGSGGHNVDPLNGKCDDLKLETAVVAVHAVSLSIHYLRPWPAIRQRRRLSSPCHFLSLLCYWLARAGRRRVC